MLCEGANDTKKEQKNGERKIQKLDSGQNMRKRN